MEDTMKFFITGTRRGLGKELAEFLPTVDSLEECDIFINNKHDGFSQVEMLYKAAEMGKRIINIGSNSPDQNKHSPHPYAVHKAALDKANHQLYYQGVNTTILRPGYFDSPRVEHIDAPKMELDYMVELVLWVIKQEYRIKELTVSV
jgi:NAD(P)-dependent dehydrogenase (short-subunit alcohol dehydrogenase family)